MEFKICSQCKEEKEATPEFFHRAAKSVDGLNSRCKSCAMEYQKRWNEKHKEKMLEEVVTEEEVETEVEYE